MISGPKYSSFLWNIAINCLLKTVDEPEGSETPRTLTLLHLPLTLSRIDPPIPYITQSYRVKHEVNQWIRNAIDEGESSSKYLCELISHMYVPQGNDRCRNVGEKANQDNRCRSHQESLASPSSSGDNERHDGVHNDQ